MIESTRSNLDYKPFAQITTKDRLPSYDELAKSNEQLREALRDLFDEKAKLFNETLELKRQLASRRDPRARQVIRELGESLREPKKSTSVEKFVEFRLSSVSMGSSRLVQAVTEVFPIYRIRSDRDLVIRCTLEQFVRFLIVRNECGANNAWKALNVKIINEVPPAASQRFDFTKG